MRVKSCEASDGGASRPIELSDENGCVLRPKMFSKFMKMRSTDARATVVTYAFFHAFKFPDSMAVHIRCKVRRTLKILARSIVVTLYNIDSFIIKFSHSHTSLFYSNYR